MIKIIGLLVMYFDAVVVETVLLLFRLALAFCASDAQTFVQNHSERTFFMYLKPNYF